MPFAGKKWIKAFIHLAILAVTLIFLVRHVSDAWSEVKDQGFAVNFGWTAAACVLYAIGLTILGAPWWLVLQSFGHEIGFASAVRTYLISHVGKYVPGKAMAIVIRVTRLRDAEVPAGDVVVSSFFETFSTMASGSLVALAALALMPPTDFARSAGLEPWMLWLVATGLCLGFFGAISPPGFHLFTAMMAKAFSAFGKLDVRRVQWALVGKTTALGIASWIVVGISYLATIHAVGDRPWDWALLPAATASVALSIVLGFVSLLPGQIFVREAVLIGALEPMLGTLHAVAASLFFRLATVVTEGCVAGICWLGGRP